MSGRADDGELGRAVRAAKSTKTTGNFGLVGGAIVLVVALFAGLNSPGIIIGVILLVSGAALRISANVGLHNAIWRLAFGAVGRAVPPSSQVPVFVQQELTLMFQQSVAEYAATGFTVPLDDLFTRRVRESGL